MAAETDIHPDYVIRIGRDDDAKAVIALIRSVFIEYDCVFDVDNEMPDLNFPASSFSKDDGLFWVVEWHGEIVGCVGFKPVAFPVAELHRLYVDHAHRQSGLGNALCQLIEGHVIKQGFDRLILWTDTRFTKAHRLYEKREYKQQIETRELHDLSNTIEYQYIKNL